jgi:uncharacterized membrane protein YfcA
MVRFLAGCGLGVFAGVLLGQVIPMRVFLIVCLALMALAVGLLFLFHLGIRDFQDY